MQCHVRRSIHLLKPTPQTQARIRTRGTALRKGSREHVEGQERDQSITRALGGVLGALGPDGRHSNPENNGDPSLGAKTSVLSSLVGAQPVARRGGIRKACRTGGSPSPHSAVHLDVTQSHHRCLFPTAAPHPAPCRA